MDFVRQTLQAGIDEARKIGAQTLEEVRTAMNMTI
jgi:hypothetical protein